MSSAICLLLGYTLSRLSRRQATGFESEMTWQNQNLNYKIVMTMTIMMFDTWYCSIWCSWYSLLVRTHKLINNSYTNWRGVMACSTRAWMYSTTTANRNLSLTSTMIHIHLVPTILSVITIFIESVEDICEDIWLIKDDRWRISQSSTHRPPDSST